MIVITYFLVAVSILVTDALPICPASMGFCVKKDGSDQNAGITRLGKNTTMQECLIECLNYHGASGCEWHDSGVCSVHTQEVAHGSGTIGYVCWAAFSKCQDNDINKKFKALSLQLSQIRKLITEQHEKDSVEHRQLVKINEHISEQIRNLSLKEERYHHEKPAPEPVTTTTTSTVQATTRTPPPPSTPKPVYWVYYPPGTHDNRAKSHYPEYNSTLVGFGMPESYDEDPSTGNVSLKDCLKWCAGLRSQKGPAYNGCDYWWHNKVCYCQKNEVGHRSNKGVLHYRLN